MGYFFPGWVGGDLDEPTSVKFLCPAVKLLEHTFHLKPAYWQMLSQNLIEIVYTFKLYIRHEQPSRMNKQPQLGVVVIYWISIGASSKNVCTYM